MLERPLHLTRRQITGRMFSEDARIVTVTTEVNEFGEPTHTESEEAIKCATAPPTGNEPRVRELIEGGVLLEAMRNFWTVQDLRPVQYGNTGTAGDIIEFALDFHFLSPQFSALNNLDIFPASRAKANRAESNRSGDGGSASPASRGCLSIFSFPVS